MNRTIRKMPMPRRITVITEKEKVQEDFTPDGAYGSAKKVQVKIAENGTIRISAPGEELKQVRIRFKAEDLIRNTERKDREDPGKGPVCAEGGAFHGSLVLGDAWERSYNEMSWRGISARRHMPWYFFLLKGDTLYAFGVKVQPSAFCFWEADSDGITLYLDVRCGGRGVQLGSRVLDAAQIVSAEYNVEGSLADTETAMKMGVSVMAACRDFCTLMCPAPLLADKPIYGSNNWYYAYGQSNRTELLRDADYLASLTRGLENRPYMVVDDGWQPDHPTGFDGGPWRGSNADYGDLKELAGEITEKGVIPGIWFRPLLNHDKTIPESWRIDRRHPMLAPVPGVPEEEDPHAKIEPHPQFLDPSVPEVLSYIQDDLTYLCQAGFRMIKHDFSTFDMFGKWGFQMSPLVTDGGWSFHDRSKTSAEIVRGFYQAIHDVCSRYGTVVLGCNAVGHLGAGLMESNRTGDDTSGLGWERTRSVGVNTLAFRLMQNGTFFEADPDCVGITGAIDWKYNRQWADVVARSGASLFVSAKPGVLTEEEGGELREILKMASEHSRRAVPADWLLTDCPEVWQDGDTRIRYEWYPEDGTDFSEGKFLAEGFMSSI